MKNFFDEDIIITDFTLVGYVPPGEGYPMQKSRPNHGLMFSCTDGKYYDFEGGQKFNVSNGDILYFPKNTGFNMQGNNGNGFVINFEIAGEHKTEPFLFKPKNKSGFLEKFKAIEAAWRKKTTGYKTKCIAELYFIIYNMKKEYECGYVSSSGKEIILPAIEFIHENYDTKMISVSELAKYCDISETYLRRLFQKVYGVSPVKYINHLKIIRAKELVLSNMYSISQVAALSGFNDEAYFGREFKKVMGVSPSKYRGEGNLLK